MSNNYTLHGSGPNKIITFSGWMGDYTVFNPTLSLWDDSKFQIAFMDYRGYGKAKDVKGKYDLDEIAADGLKVTEELGWSEFSIIGHSMGGMVAQKLNLLAKDKVKSVACLAPVPASGFPMDPDSDALFSGAVENPENRRQILDFTTGNKNTAEWLDQMVKDSLATTTREAYGSYFKAWSGTDFSSKVQGLKTPYLVLVGEYDLAITKETMDGTYGTWLANCKIDVLKDCGHYPMQENPKALVEALQKFFS